MISYIGGRGISAIQGALVPVETLGYISIAGIFGWALGDMTVRFVGAVGFPKMAMIYREDPARFVETLRKLRSRLLLLTLPGFVALSLIATPLIDFLYDPRYAVAGTYLSILAISGAISVQPLIYVNAFLAVGESRFNFLFSLVSTICRVSGLTIGFMVGGAIGMLIGTTIGTLIYFGVVAVLAYRRNWLSLRIDLAALAFIFLGAWISWGWVNF